MWSELDVSWNNIEKNVLLLFLQKNYLCLGLDCKQSSSDRRPRPGGTGNAPKITAFDFCCPPHPLLEQEATTALFCK